MLYVAGQLIERGKNKWLVRVYMGKNEEGKRKYHNRTIHGNKKAAQAYLNKMLRDKDLGTFVEPSKEYFGKYLDVWLETAAKPRVRAKTFQNYKDLVRLYIKPALGENKLSLITPEQIQSLYNKMLDDELSPKTIKNVHGVLRNALDQAAKWGKLYRNPADLVDLPKQKKKEMQAFSPIEANAFLDAINYSRWKALFSLLLTTGMRPGEALALKWKDVDLDGYKVTVNRTLTRIAGNWSIEEPKTSRSRRTIPIPISVVEHLKDFKKEQAAEILQAKVYANHGFVFAGKTGDPLDERNIVNRHFKPLLKSAGLPIIRLYDLRHTCATLLLSAGENPKVVSERLGHASVTLTMDTYSHVLPDMQEAATKKLEDMLFTKDKVNNNLGLEL